ncbi:MAG: hypothetical protein AABX02_00500 [archaeon]
MAAKAKKEKVPGKVAGKVIRKQLKGVKSDIKEVKSGVTKQVKGVKSSAAKQAKATKSGVAKEMRGVRSGVSKEVKSVRSGVTKEVNASKKSLTKSIARQTKKMTTQNTAIQQELEKLRADLNKSKGKKPARQLSMYNLFVKKQIEQGKTFEEATRSWKTSRALIENPDLAKKAGKTRTITKTRTVIKRVPGKTKTIVKEVPGKTRTIIRNVPGKTKTKIVYRTRNIKSAPQIKEVVRVERLPADAKESLNKIMKDLSALKADVSHLERETHSPSRATHVAMPMSLSKTVTKSSHSMMDGDVPNEEVAMRLTKLYFEEIARLGFKRRLDFDAIINAYYYCLQRLGNKSKEMEVMRKIVEREETKISTETKSELFPQGQ